MLGLIYVFMRFVPEYRLVAERGSATPQEADRVRASTEVHDQAGSVINIASTADIFDTLLITSIIVLVAMGFTGSIVAWVMAGRMLEPLKKINDAAVLAGRGTLTHRIQLVGPPDEFHRVADTFDHMLDQLSDAFKAHERFAANAAHELRTPLTATRTLLEVARAHPREQNFQLLTQRLSTANEKSISIVQSLLDLTSIERGAIRREEHNLVDLARNAVSDAQERAESCGLTIVADLGDAHAMVDGSLTAQVFSNLLSNAINHNHLNGRVTVTTGVSVQGPYLEVANSGNQIAPATIPLLTEPLFRVAGRTGDWGERGHGLGLAIVHTIVRAHGADLSILPNSGGGLIVRIAFP